MKRKRSLALVFGAFIMIGACSTTTHPRQIVDGYELATALNPIVAEVEGGARRFTGRLTVMVDPDNAELLTELEARRDELRAAIGRYIERAHDELSFNTRIGRIRLELGVFEYLNAELSAGRIRDLYMPSSTLLPSGSHRSERESVPSIPPDHRVLTGSTALVSEDSPIEVWTGQSESTLVRLAITVIHSGDTKILDKLLDTRDELIDLARSQIFASSPDALISSSGRDEFRARLGEEVNGLLRLDDEVDVVLTVFDVIEY